MPSLKVSVNPEAKSAFENYEGPTPPVGNGYEGIIKNVRVKQGKESGNPYLNVLIEHDSKEPNRKQYNGAPQWVRVMFGEHDETQARLAAFIKAVTGKANKEANIVDTDVDARSGTGSLVKTIDGVKPDGKRVKFDVREEAAQNGYEARLSADFIRRALDATVDAGAADAEEADEDLVDEEDLEVEDDVNDEDEGDDVTREEREAELKKEALADLRAAAKEAEIDIKGLKKAEIIEAILDWEFEGEDEADDESDEEEEEDVELGGDGDEEEESDEEEDEEDEDPEGDIRAELAELDRAALKARLKESDPEAKVLKKDSDDDLRDKIVNAELGDTPL
jgi:hypothetical protein